VRVGVHVKPGAAATLVGGAHDGALVVRVTERAEGGRATEAAMTALAGALGVHRRALTLRSGARSPKKLVEVAVDDAQRRLVEARLAALLAARAGGRR
jgi:uncharacterized protein YggU (UPF0235/DUF167 family)